MNQYKALDVLKFLAAFLVIGIHSKPFDTYIIKCIECIAVPFFFTASSFLFFLRNGTFSKFARRISILYISWFLLELYVVYERFFQNDTLFSSIGKFLHALLLTNTFYESWYLIALLETIGIVYFLSRKCSNVILAFLGIILYIPPLLFSAYYGNMTTEHQQILRNLYSIIPVTNSCVIALIYAVLGKMASDIYKQRGGGRFSLLAFLWLLSIILWGIEAYIQKQNVHNFKAFIMLPVVAFLLVLISVNPIFNKLPLSAKFCKNLRSYSTLIFFSHVLFIGLIGFTMGLKHTFSAYVIVALLSVSFSVIVVELSKKIKILRFIF